MMIYLESCQPEVTHLNVVVLVYQDIMALEVSVNNAKRVHVMEHQGHISSYSHFLLCRDGDGFL